MADGSIRELVAFVRGFDAFVSASAIYFVAVAVLVARSFPFVFGQAGMQAAVLVWENVLLFAVAYAGFVLAWRRSGIR
jgi:hypothetical protein